MSYLGRGLDNVSNVEKLDNITFNGGTTYALTKSSAAFFPAGSNNILISIDGVVQQGNFSVSGSNIVFTFSPTSSNTCDFIMHYGTGLITTPADSSVTEAKIGSNAVTKDKTNFVSTSSSPGLEIKGDNTTDGTLQLNCRVNSHGVKLKSPPHSAGQSYTLTLPSTAPATDKMLQTDGSGNLSFVDAPSGTWVRLGGTDATGLSDITYDVFSSTYKVYKIIGSHNMGTNNTRTQFRMRKSGSDQTSNHYRSVTDAANRTSSTGAADFNFSRWDIDYARITTGSSDSASHPTSMEIDIFAPFDSTRQTSAIAQCVYYQPENGTWNTTTGGFWIDSTSGVDNTGIKIYASSGTIDNADYSIYGLKEA